MMTMKDIRRYVIESPEALRKDCIANGWFTCGTNRQFEKMFGMNNIINGFSLRDIAVTIWTCSQEKGFDEIEKYLQEAQEDYLEDLQMEINNANIPSESEWLENIARR